MQLSPTVEKSGWIQTYSGVKFEILDPTIAMIKRADIAHGLSMICRFNGHTRWFYSVAQHSLLVMELVKLELERVKLFSPAKNLQILLHALLHDASEAYIGDVTRPLKRLYVMNSYREVEQNISDVISLKFDLEREMPALISRADQLALLVEARDLMSPLHPEWADKPVDIDHIPRITPMSPEQAERAFLTVLHCLENARLAEVGKG